MDTLLLKSRAGSYKKRIYGDKITSQNIYTIMDNIDNKDYMISLIIEHTSLTSLKRNCFDQFINLLELCITNSNVTSIPKHLFDNLLNLKRVCLTKNKITFLSLGMFSKLKFLQSLNLSNNLLTNLDKCNFIGANNIQFLNLSFNKINKINEDSFIYLPQLESLWLKKNKLKNFKINMSFNKLKDLDLSHNKLSTLSTEMCNFINLEIINLQYNKLTSLPAEILKIKNVISIDETSYDINNINMENEILIFSDLNIKLSNLPINTIEIWLNKKIINYEIKTPFGCQINFF